MVSIVNHISEGVGLITLVAGFPAAWMISSNGTEATVDHFIAALKKNNPGVNPRVIMSDFDWCQINVARRHHPAALVLLCWWHVLHAWQQHLRIDEHPELWKLLKGWIRLTEISEFNKCWVGIQSLAPTYFIEYIQNTWWKHWKMWYDSHRSHSLPAE